MLFASHQETLQSILKHVGDLGWDQSAWSDDNLASRKVYPKCQFSTKSKKWLPRIKTCDESMALLIRRVQMTHQEMPLYMRRKLEVNQLEALAERAAAVWHLAKEVQLSVPLSDDVIKREWLDARAS